MASVTIDNLVSGNLVMHDHSEADLGAILDPRYVNVTGDTMTGNLNMGTYNLIGGTGITDILKLQSTTGNGTLTSPAIQLLTGNNGATTAVTVLNNGNVGIGTTAPTAPLDVVGSFKVKNSAGTNYMTFDTSGSGVDINSTSGGFFINYSNANSVNIGSGFALTGKTWINPSSSVDSRVGIGVAQGTTPAGKLEVAGTGNVIFNTSGNVGIGTTSPAGKLHINGTADDEQLIIRGNSTQTANLTEWQNSSGTALAYLKIPTGSSPTEMYLNPTIADPTSNDGVLKVSPTFTHSANRAYIAPAMAFNTISNTGGYTVSYAIGASGTVQATGTGGTISSQWGVSAQSVTSGSFTGTVTSSVAINAAGVSVPSGTVSNHYGFFYNSASVTGGGVLTKEYGIYLQNVNSASGSNYAIFTNSGLNELNDQLFVDGSADRIQLRVQAHSTQTTNLQTWENSSGTVLSRVSGLGYLGIGVDPTYPLQLQFSDKDSGYMQYMSAGYKDITAEANAYGAVVTSNFTTNNANAVRGFVFDIRQTGTANATTYTEGAKFTMRNTGAGIVTYLDGLKFSHINSGAGSVTIARGFVFDAPTISAGSIGTVYAIQIGAITGASTTNRGINIDNITGNGASAIVTNAGNIVFNEGGDASTDFRVESDTKANMLFVDASADAVGINQASPTAYLHIGAGGTGAGTAPFKLTTQASGLTNVEQGAFELIGNSLQFTQLAKRRGVQMSQSVRTSTTTYENSVTETASLLTAEHGVNYLETGKCEILTLVGTLEQRANPSATCTFAIKYAGSTLFSLATSANNRIAAGSPFCLRIWTTVRSTGTTGTLQVNAILECVNETDKGGTTLATINTTTAQDTTVTATWGEANAANILKVEQAFIQCIETNK